MMRTTLTIEDRLIEALRQRAREEGKPFKDVVNEVVSAGLQVKSQPPGRAYRLKPASLGQVRPGYDLTKAREISDELEDHASAEKLEQRQ